MNRTSGIDKEAGGMQSALEQVVERFPQQVAERVVERSNAVIGSCAAAVDGEIAEQAIPSAVMVGDRVDTSAARHALEDVWRPRIQRRICEKTLFGCGGSRRMTEMYAPLLATDIVCDEADSLIAGANPGQGRPYGIPFRRATLLVDQGGYAEWDRDLLLSPHVMRGSAGMLVALVPHDEPGMRDGLIENVVENAVNDLILPSEAHGLPAARAFAIELGRTAAPWDGAKAAERLSGLRSRCGETAAGRLAIALRDLLDPADRVLHFASGGTPGKGLWPSPELARRTSTAIARAAATTLSVTEGAAGMEAARQFLLQGLSENCSEMLEGVSRMACSRAYGEDGEGAERAATAIARDAPRLLVNGTMALERMMDRGRTRPDDDSVLQKAGLFLISKQARIAGLYETLHGLSTRPVPLVDLPLRDRGDEFTDFSALGQRRHSLDPVLAVGFVGLDAGVTMPEAEYLLDLMGGWVRMCRAAAILSCPEYGAVVPCDVDVVAGTEEVLRRCDEIVPGLEPVWRDAFERQRALFADEMADIGRLYEEAQGR